MSCKIWSPKGFVSMILNLMVIHRADHLCSFFSFFVLPLHMLAFRLDIHVCPVHSWPSCSSVIVLLVYRPNLEIQTLSSPVDFFHRHACVFAVENWRGTFSWTLVNWCVTECFVLMITWRKFYIWFVIISYCSKLDAIHAFAREGDEDKLLKCIQSGVPLNLKG